MKFARSSFLRSVFLVLTCLACSSFSNIFAQDSDQTPFPKVVQAVSPVYPKALLPVRGEGRVVVEIKIAPNGRVVSATRASGPVLFIPSALKAARSWIFVPVRVRSMRTAYLTFIFRVVDHTGLAGVTYIDPGTIELAAFTEDPSAANAGFPRHSSDPSAPAVLTTVGAVYPVVARAAHAAGKVDVDVTIDRAGNVIAAKAISGNPLLKAVAVNSAKQWKFDSSEGNGEQHLLIHYLFLMDSSARMRTYSFVETNTVVVPMPVTKVNTTTDY